jgi:hypothetical protein
MQGTGGGANIPAIAPGDWAYEAAHSRTHAFVKLIVHTLRVLMKDGLSDLDVSDDDLARLTSLSTKTVQRYRQIAEKEGWLEFTIGRGRSKISSYKIAVPMATISEIAMRLDALTSSRTDSPPYAPENRTPSPTTKENWTDSPPFEREKRTDSPPFATDFKKERSPTPPKEKTTPPVCPPPAADTHSDGVKVNGSGIVIRVAGRELKFDYQTIDYWAATNMCSPDRARMIVESVGRGWVVEGRCVEHPATWMQRQIAKWRVRKAADDAEMAKSAAVGASSRPDTGFFEGKFYLNRREVPREIFLRNIPPDQRSRWEQAGHA